MSIKLNERKKLLIYKIVLFLFAFIVAFLPQSVSRSREVNSRVIVEILGVDGGDKVEITAQYVMPTETEGATSKDTVTVKANTVTEAVESLNTALGRRAELGHCSLVIVGDETAPELLGTLMTATDVTADVYVCAAEKKASELVGEITDFMKKTGATDADFIAYSAKKAHIATNTLLGFLSDLGSESHTAYIPVVQMLKSESGASGQGGGESGGDGSESGGGESEKPEQSGMKVERLALYDPDGRKGVLDRLQARGVAWVSAPVEKGIVTADVEYDGEVVKDVSGRLLKKRVEISVDPRSNSATVSVRATIEPNGDKFNRLDSKVGKQASAAIKSGFASAIESEIRSAYDEAAKYSCDPLFIARQFYRFSPEYFASEYSQQGVTVNIDVEVVLK